MWTIDIVLRIRPMMALTATRRTIVSGLKISAGNLLAAALVSPVMSKVELHLAPAWLDRRWMRLTAAVRPMFRPLLDAQRAAAQGVRSGPTRSIRWLLRGARTM
ncbi:hypothetical protein [Rhodopseudomonas palustris]|uniref:hypothetical protein n=1 Tax=Rhodopseudomonas palustris TaxID=1076 RepID=UPI0005A2F68B